MVEIDYLTRKAMSMGVGPICNKCDKPVTISISGGKIIYHCHDKEEEHIDLIGYQHPEKVF